MSCGYNEDRNSMVEAAGTGIPRSGLNGSGQQDAERAAVSLGTPQDGLRE